MAFFQSPPPGPVTAATGAQPYAGGKIAAVIPPPTVTHDSPPGFTQQIPFWEDDVDPSYYLRPIFHQEGAVAQVAQVPFVRPSVLAQWYIDDLTAYYLRPIYHQEGTIVPPPEVDEPPGFTLQVPFWEDDPPLPILPRYYPQPGPVVVADQFPSIRVWLSGIVQAWQPSDPFPTQANKLSPGIPGQSVDNPPPLKDINYWIVPESLPQQRQLPSPGIPGRSVDNPPRLKFRRQHPETTWIIPDPFPAQVNKLSPGIPGQSVDNPPGLKFRRQHPETTWIVLDPPPTQANKLSPGIPGQSVDNPPTLVRQPQPVVQEPPQLTLPRLYPQPFVAVTAQNPFVPPWLSTVLQAWQPADLQAILRQLLNPSITAVPVNDPPFDRRHLEEFLRQWQPPDPLPTLPRFLAAALLAVQVDNPPFDRRRLEDFLRAWLPPDPFPHQQRKLSPGIPGQSVDNPPGLIRPFQPGIEEVRLPILPVRLPQAAAAGQPALQAWLATVIQAWVARDPDIARQLKLPADLLAVRVDNPPFSMRGRNELDNIIRQWPLEQWLVRQVLLNPNFLAVAVNNPPFSHLGRKELAEIITAWQAAPYDWELIQRLNQVVQEGPFVPPVIVAERFTVSGPDVRDLFGPIGDVSWNWEGGTQKRTV